jgi:hypothetical protein
VIRSRREIEGRAPPRDDRGDRPPPRIFYTAAIVKTLANQGASRFRTFQGCLILVVASLLSYSQRTSLAEFALNRRLPGMWGKVATQAGLAGTE